MITTNLVSHGAAAKLTGVNSGLAAAEHPITAERVKKWRRVNVMTVPFY